MFRLGFTTALALFTLPTHAGTTTNLTKPRRDPTLPAKPALTRVSAVSLFEIDLTWRDNSSNEDGFQIERSKDHVHFEQIAQVLPGTIVYRDKHLFPGTRYFYRVRAFNSAGTSGYSTGAARTPTPPRPLTIAEWGYSPLGVPTGTPPTNQDLVSISVSPTHSLALRKDGTVVGWGDDFYRESTAPTNLTGVVAIAAGTAFSVALKSDGTIFEWGHDADFFLAPPPGLTNVVAVAAGADHCLALKGDGTLVGWGYEEFGETIPPNLSGVVAIATGSDQSLALKSDGTVVLWGYNPLGVENPPTNLNSVVDIAVGSDMSFAIKSDGTVFGWGIDKCQMITNASNFTAVRDIVMGDFRNVALKNDGTLVDWGCEAADLTPPDLGKGAVMISGRGTRYAALTTAPLPPSNLNLVVLADNKISLSWQDNSIDERGFQIERAPANYPSLDWTQIATVDRGRTNYTDTTLAAGTTYWYRVRAYSGLGASTYCSQVPVVTTPLVPPQGLSASLGTNQVNLSWSDLIAFNTHPYFALYSGIDGFKIERALDESGVPGSWNEIASVAIANASSNPAPPYFYSFADTTVEPNTTYWYRVRSFNALGDSSYTNIVSIGVLPPSAPPYLSVNASTDQAWLSWAPNLTLAQGVKIERAPDINGSPGAWTEIAETNSQIGFYEDSGLSANTTYWYRIRAFNWVGDSPYTDPVSVTIVPPQPPNSFTATLDPTNGVQLSWYQSPSDEDGFKIERAPDVGGAPGTWSEIASLNDTNADSAEFLDTNALANTTYCYRVRAFNVVGFSDYSLAVSIKIVPPPTPVSLTAKPIANRVELTWWVIPTGPIGSISPSTFEIERALDANGTPGDWTQIATVPSSFFAPFNFVDTNLVAGAAYWYRVRATNWVGNSPYSSPVVVTIVPPAAPDSVSESINTNANQVNVTWNDSATDEDGFYIERAVDTGTALGAWTQIGTVNHGPVGADSFIDTNATAFATNWYRVRAYNIVGISDYSPATSIAVVPPAAPSLEGYAFSDQAILNWSDYNYTFEATLGYKLERAPDNGGNPGPWTQIAQISRDITTYTDPGLAANSTNWYRIRAYNWVGDSDYSAPWAIAIVPPSAPAAPYASVGTTNHSVDLTIIDYRADQDGFTIERAADAGGNSEVWAQIGRVNLTNQYYATFTDTNAQPNTTNWYRVLAFSASGISEPSDGTQLTVIPPGPPHLSGNAFTNLAILTWYDNSTFAAGVTGYKLQRAPDVNGTPGAWIQLTNTPDTEFTDSGLADNTTYWYRVSSYNWVGDSPFSNPLTITITPPPPPGDVQATPGTTNQVNLNIYDYTMDEDGFKIERLAADNTNGTWVEIGTVLMPRVYDLLFVDSNAMPNQTYSYRVRAFNSLGLSDYSKVATISVAPPDAPTIGFVRLYNDTIQLDWIASYGEAIAGFHIDRAPDVGGSPGNWTTIGTNTGFTTYYSDGNLSAQTAFWYRIRAFNWVGESLPSSSARVTITPPGTPLNVNCSPGATNQGIISWSDYVMDQDGFNIERAPDAGGVPGAWVNIGSVIDSNAISGTFTDTNVAANSTNWYRVQAFNAFGESPFSGSNSLVIVPPTNAPTLTAAAAGLNQIDLSFYWYQPTGFIDGYAIERAFDTNGAPGTWVQIADVANNYSYSSYNDSAVVPTRKYWYRVRAYNWAGSSPYSNAVLVDDDPPGAPVLSAVNDQSNQITLNWNKTADNLTGFKIERAPDNVGVPGTWIQIAEPIIYQYQTNFLTTYADTNITVGQTYWYRIRASNPVGDSPYSNEASATSRNGQFVRVMQWDVNGAVGRPGNNPYFTAQTVVDIMNYNHPDVLLLNGIDAQGLTPAQNEAALSDLVTNYLTYLGTLPGATFYVAVSAQSDGVFRNAVISRYPILNETNYDDGLRGLHAFQVQIPDTNVLQIFQAHLATNDCAQKETEAEFDTNIIAAFAATNPLPYIVAGDWNEDEDAPLCTPSETFHPISTIRTGAGLGDFKPTDLSRSDNTWNTLSNSPTERLDYLLSATNRISPVSGYVFNSMDWQTHGIYGGFGEEDNYYSSDHYPVFATFYFNAPIETNAPASSLPGSDGGAGIGGLTGWRLSTSNGSATPLITPPSSAPQIIALTPTNDSVLVEWLTTGGSTDTLQAADGAEESYSNISPPLFIGGSGSTTTNYLDAGALTNGPVRFYRIHSSR